MKPLNLSIAVGLVLGMLLLVACADNPASNATAAGSVNAQEPTPAADVKVDTLCAYLGPYYRSAAGGPTVFKNHEDFTSFFNEYSEDFSNRRNVIKEMTHLPDFERWTYFTIVMEAWPHIISDVSYGKDTVTVNIEIFVPAGWNFELADPMMATFVYFIPFTEKAIKIDRVTRYPPPAIKDGPDENTPPNPPTAQTLNGTAWKLTGVGGMTEKTFRTLEPQDCKNCYNLVFNSDTSYGGFSTANEFWGEYTVDYINGTIQLGRPSMTKALSNPDGQFFEHLFNGRSITSFERENNKLKLYYNDEQNRIWYLLFEQKAYPTAPTLKGFKWKLQGIGGPGKADFRALEGTDCEKCYTLIFDTDTTFSGFSTANDFQGEYRADYTSGGLRSPDYAIGNVQFRITLITLVLDIPDGQFFERVFSNRATSFSIFGNEFWLHNEENDNYLIFEKKGGI